MTARRSYLPLVAGVAGLVAFLSTLAAVAFLFLRGGGADDRRYWPDNATLVMSLDVQRMRLSEGYKALIAGSPELARQFDQQTGLSNDAIDRMTMAGDPAGAEPIIVLHANRALTIEEAMKATGKPGAVAETVGAHTVYVGSPLAACRVDERTLVMGPVAGIKAVLTRNAPAVLSDTMAGLMAQADFGACVVVVADTSSLGSTMERELAMTPAAGAAKDLRAVIVEGDLTAKVDLRVTAVWTDGPKAEEMRKMFEGLIVMGKQQLSQLPAEAQQFAAVLDSIKVSTSGPNLLMTLSMDAATIKGALPK